MTTIYKLSKKEKELLKLLTKGSLTAADDFSGWRKTVEFDAFIDNKLIYHCNASHEGVYIRYGLTDLGKKLAAKTFRPKVRRVNQLTPITTKKGYTFPFDLRCVRIELDKDNIASRKEHQIVYQQGRNYGSVGDYCYSIGHDELFELEEKGMIKIN